MMIDLREEQKVAKNCRSTAVAAGLPRQPNVARRPLLDWAGPCLPCCCDHVDCWLARPWRRVASLHRVDAQRCPSMRPKRMGDCQTNHSHWRRPQPSSMSSQLAFVRSQETIPVLVHPDLHSPVAHHSKRNHHCPHWMHPANHAADHARRHPRCLQVSTHRAPEYPLGPSHLNGSQNVTILLPLLAAPGIERRA